MSRQTFTPTKLSRTQEIYAGRLHLQLKEAFPDKFEHIEKEPSSNDFDMIFNQDLTQPEIDQIDNDILANHDNVRYYAKILELALPGSKDKDFRGLDYTVELSQKLFRENTMVRGELQKVEYWDNAAKDNKLIQVDIVYNRNDMGFAESRTTTRTWFSQTGSELENKKVTTKYYDMLGQIQEGKRRRGNIVDAMQMPILGMMMATLPGMSAPWNTMTQPEIIQLGRDFLKLHDTSFSAFINESHKQILDDVLNASDAWLDNVIDGNGTTIRGYILNQMNLEDDATYIL